MKDLSQLLSEEITEALFKGFSKANPGKILDSKEFGKILKWAEEVEISKALLSGIIGGDILPSVNEEGEIVFSVSEKGIREVDMQSLSIKLPQSDKIQ